MRAHINITNPRLAWRTLGSLAVVAGALALPAAASARPIDSGPYVVHQTGVPNVNQATVSHSATIARPNEGTYVASTTLRRDGSQAVPFVANVGTPAPSAPSAGSDSFDWGDAGIGAAAAVGLAALGAGAVALRRRGGLEPSTS
jgi:hypothetical protein